MTTEPPRMTNTDAQLLAAIVLGSDDAIATKTLDGTVTSWNPAAERMFGYTAKDMLGQPMLRIFPSDRHGEEHAILERLRRGEKVDHFETVRLHRSGRPIHVSVTVSPLHDAAGRVIGASTIARDVGERVERERLIWAQAHLDALTQLPNRRLFAQRLDAALGDAQRRGGRLALLYVDLDHFKSVNDQLGHAAGDALLIEFARRIRACVRDGDTVARMGGDEFIVLLPLVTDLGEAPAVAQRIQQALADPLPIAGHALHACASIGIAHHPDDGPGADALLRHADQAMFDAKRQRRVTTHRATRGAPAPVRPCPPAPTAAPAPAAAPRCTTLVPGPCG